MLIRDQQRRVPPWTAAVALVLVGGCSGWSGEPPTPPPPPKSKVCLRHGGSATKTIELPCAEAFIAIGDMSKKCGYQILPILNGNPNAAWNDVSLELSTGGTYLSVDAGEPAHPAVTVRSLRAPSVVKSGAVWAYVANCRGYPPGECGDGAVYQFSFDIWPSNSSQCP